MTDITPKVRQKLILDDDKKFVLMKFKRSVADVLQPHHDDTFLLRWLRARSWNPTAAEQMLRNSLKWRERWGIDTELLTWEPPEVIALYHPSGNCGYDKDGVPIIIIPFAGLDIVGMLHSVTRKDLLKATIQILERSITLGRKNGVQEVVAIFDMDGFLLRNYAWKPAAEMIITLLKLYEANYPELLKVCYIINAPRVFAIAFNVVKRFLNDYTISKIQILKNEPTKWKKALLQNIDASNLPKYLGGNLTDPDGNPRYTTQINPGGKVPKMYYKKNLPLADEPKKEYKTSVIKQGAKLILEYPVIEEGCFLKWDFRTDDHDIRFGVVVKNRDGETKIVIEDERVSAQFSQEVGVIECQAPATYIVTFDNSYSILRNKKLYYHIMVTPPIHKLKVNTDNLDDEEIIIDENQSDNHVKETIVAH